MADQKISELTAITGANTADDDLLVIVDTSASQTKKITLGELENALAERDFNFGDNDKLTFGAGSDLQIYHTSSASYITDSGTGNLYLGADNLRVTTADGLGFYFTADNGGASTIYHNASPKLATTSTGVDVTGTVTADGLTVDTNTLHVDSTNNRVGIGTSSPTSTLDLRGTLRIDGGGNSYIYSNVSGVNFETSGARFTRFLTNSSEAMRIDSSGNVGIGTSSPSGELHVLGSGGGNGDSYVERTSGAILHQQAQSALGIFGTSSNHDLAFKTNGSVRMRIDTSGNVGIGTSSPTGKLHVNSGASNEVARFESTDGTAYLSIMDNNTSNSLQGIGSAGNDLTFYANNGERMRIDSSGRVGIGTTTPSTTLVVKSPSAAGEVRIDSDSGAGRIHSNGDLQFYTNASDYSIQFKAPNDGGEHMRIDSSGNLLVSKTSSSFSTVGSEFGPALNSEGWVGFLTSNNTSANVGGTIALNRKSTDGDIARFFKDGTTVGSIGTQGGDKLTIGNGDVGVAFNPSVDSIYPWNTATNGARDASVDLGYSDGASTNIRFRNLYLSGGVYLGGTGSANKLDDYEEGTWTASLHLPPTGVSNLDETSGLNRYTKVGNFVTVQGKVTLNTNSSSGSTFRLSGLPFTTSSNTAITGSMIVRNGANFDFTPYVFSNSAEVHFYQSGTTGNWNQVQYSEIANLEMHFEISYFAA